MLDADTDAIMHARYIADQVRLGKKTLSAKERSALAMGFDACDRQRAAALTAAEQAEKNAKEASDITRAVIAMEEKLAKYATLEAEARGLLAKARVCVDRPWMGCAMDHDTIENWIGDAVDALDPKQGAADGE